MAPPTSQQAPRGIATWTRTEPDRVAFYSDDETRTYGELDARSTRLAHALAALGVAAEDRVAIMLPNSIEFFETWLAASKIGASVVLVNWHLKSDELAYILEDSGAKALVSHRDLAPQHQPALEATGAEAIIVGQGGGRDYEEAIDKAPQAPLEREVEALIAPVFYTSGTTGRPKGVIHGLAALAPSAAAAMIEGQVALWSWTSDDVYICSGPAYHAGPGGWTMAALYVGAPTVILAMFDASEWLRLVEQHRVTCSFMVPAHFIRILEVPEAERAGRDLSSLRLLVHAGAPCPIPVKRKIIEALPCEISELYGASEGGATRITSAEWLERPGSVGTPWPGVEVHILDDEGTPVPTGEQGIVYIRPPGESRFHYHDDPNKTAEAWRDQGFTVGDVGYLDDAGYLFLTDRASDMVIRGGVNIYPREIEEVLYTHPAVVDCAVFGVPDDRLGEQLHAVVEVRASLSGVPTTPHELRAHCVEHLADFKVPKDIELVDELPRQPNGKVLKRLLRDKFWEGRTTRI
ncbi:MAG: AMP-binding protein [Actinobacteria bacterium]|nr:AMP-binding protein [Actinomycetota bacterium]